MKTETNIEKALWDLVAYVNLCAQMEVAPESNNRTMKNALNALKKVA